MTPYVQVTAARVRAVRWLARNRSRVIAMYASQASCSEWMASATARKTAGEVLGELAERSERARKIHASYLAFRERTGPWSHISIRAVLDAREG